MAKHEAGNSKLRQGEEIWKVFEAASQRMRQAEM